LRLLHFTIKTLAMTTLRSLLVLIPLAGLAACADMPTQAALPASPTSVAAIPEANDTGSLYGLFLAASKAVSDGHSQVAADYFAKAAQSDPSAGFLRERAFTAALFAGDVHRAAGLAPEPGQASLSVQRLGQLTRAVDALAEGHGHEAQAALGPEPLGPPHREASLLLAPWAAAAAGDSKAALTLPDARGDLLITEVSTFDQALLFERFHHYEDAEAAFHKLTSGGETSEASIIGYGGFLERRGRKADAKALYETALKVDAGNAPIRAALDRTVAGGAAPAQQTINQGAAQALLAPAEAYFAERQPELGLTYLRLALRLDPTHDDARILLGDTLVAAGDLDSARDAYDHVQPGSPQYVGARARLTLTYQGPNDAPKALAIAEETLKAAPNDDDALELLADCLRTSEKYDESAKILDTLIAHKGDHASWQLYYMRGVALAEADHWPQAEPDLKKALALKPDDPEVLNYLGFSYVDKGEHLIDAKAMIEKAAAARPDSGAIIDSLGWAYFKLGDYQNAVAQLERAVGLEAADPDINDHLGDAYFRVGRVIEARYQWQRVLTLGPSATLRQQVEMKLKSGPGAPRIDAPAHVAQVGQSG
jgi:tetratricopeptide (TPR) repeat protein